MDEVCYLGASVLKAGLLAERVRGGEGPVTYESGCVGEDVRNTIEVFFVRWGCEMLVLRIVALDCWQTTYLKTRNEQKPSEQVAPRNYQSNSYTDPFWDFFSQCSIS